jgi:hypothetical protein
MNWMGSRWRTVSLPARLAGRILDKVLENTGNEPALSQRLANRFAPPVVDMLLRDRSSDREPCPSNVREFPEVHVLWSVCSALIWFFTLQLRVSQMHRHRRDLG